MSVPEVECKRTYQRRQQILYNMSAVKAIGRIYEAGEKKKFDIGVLWPGDQGPEERGSTALWEAAYYGRDGALSLLSFLITLLFPIISIIFS